MMNRRTAILRALGPLVGLALLAGCTVQPLNAPDAAFTGGGALSSVSVEPVDTRVAQQVRNRLIFLLTGGGATPAPAFSAELTIDSTVQDLLRVQAPDDDALITARRVTVTGMVTLTRIGDGAVITRQTRSATASFDNTRQEFANMRALRDAEDRAARQLAEQLRMVVATALAGA